MRPTIAAANWKMHKTVAEASAYFASLPNVEKSCVVKIYVPFTLLATARALVAGRADSVIVGAQNFHPALQGAYTGEVSLGMLDDIGVRSVLVGHSERRHVFGESLALVAEKTEAAVRAGFDVCLCVGETDEQRENGQTRQVLSEQLQTALAPLQEMDVKEGLSVAYEPVWAIGTGKTATASIAEDAHSFIRSELNRLGGGDGRLGERTSILYGGSVKPENAGELSAQPNIDGVLVGGASLEPSTFYAIINAL